MFRKDLKYKIKKDQNIFCIYFQSKLTGCWIIASARTFNKKEDAINYLKNNKE